MKVCQRQIYIITDPVMPSGGIWEKGSEIPVVHGTKAAAPSLLELQLEAGTPLYHPTANRQERQGNDGICPSLVPQGLDYI